MPASAGGRARSWWLLIGLLAVVLAVKLVMAVTLASHPLLQPVDDLDTGEYWRLAQRVATGDVLLSGTALHVSPLYIYWLALALIIGGGTVTGVLVLQAVAGTAAVWLVGRTAAAWVDPAASTRLAAAIAAGGSLALTGIIALQEALILQSALDPILMAGFAAATTRALHTDAPGRWAVCGGALALLAMNRPNAWLLALPCLAALVMAPGNGMTRPWRRVPMAGAWMFGLAVVLAPVVLRTGVATGAWEVLPSHGGLNVYIGNHAVATGTYTIADGIRPSMAGQREDMRQVAERAAGQSLSDAQVSRYFMRAALAWWGEAPAAALRLLAFKAWLTTHAWELPVNVSYAWFREQIWLLRLLPGGAWLLIPLGLAVSVAGAAWVPDVHRRAWRGYRWCLPAYLTSVALVFVVDRYRAPALVLCAIHVGILAGGLAQRTWDAAPVHPDPGPWPGRWRGLLAAALVLTLCGANLVALPFQLGEAEADTRMALHEIDSGDDEQARRWLTRAVARHPAPGLAWLRAGLAWQARGQMPQAESALREARRLDPDQEAVAFALGELLLTQGRGAEAVPLLAQTLRAGLRPDRTRLDLALALWQAGDQPAAQTMLVPRLPVEALPLLRARALAAANARRIDLAVWLLGEYRRYMPGDAEVAETLGLATARQGDEQAATRLLEEAVGLDGARATARFNLAIARVRQGRREEAIELLRGALRIDPSYAHAAGALRELLDGPQLRR